MKVECSSCKKSFQVKDEYAGRRGRCPACKEVIVIPTSTSKPISAFNSRPCPKCAKPIFGEDVVCTFCGYDTRGGQAFSLPKKKAPRAAGRPTASSFAPPVGWFEEIRKWAVIAVGVVIAVNLLPKVTYRNLYDVGPKNTVIRSFSQLSEMPLAQDAVSLVNEQMNLMAQGMLNDNTKFTLEPPKAGCRHLMIACPYLRTKNIGDTVRELEPYRLALAAGARGGEGLGVEYMLVVNTPGGSLLASTGYGTLFDSLQLITVLKEDVFEGYRLGNRSYFGMKRLTDFDVSLNKNGSGARMVEDLFNTVTIIPQNEKEVASVEELKGAIEKLADDIRKMPAVSKGQTPFITGGIFKSLLTQKYKDCPYMLLGAKVFDDKVLDDQLITETGDAVIISGNGRQVGPADLVAVGKLFPEGRKFQAIRVTAPRISREEKAQATLILKDLPLNQTYALTRAGKAAGTFSLPMTRLNKGTWWLSLISFTILSLVFCRGTVMAGDYINGHENLPSQRAWILTGVCGGLLLGMAVSIAFALSVVEAGSITIGDQMGSFLVNAGGGLAIFTLLGIVAYAGAGFSDLPAKTTRPKGPIQYP